MWIVVLMNVAIAMGCFYLARRTWRLHYKLERLERRILLLDRRVNTVLQQTTHVFEKQQVLSSNLKGRYLRLEIQIQQLQKILTLLNLGLGLWRWQRRRR
ncbi:MULTISPECIES: hypothetical protein [Arthrospira]|uniref:Uncharacterized protein n=1 Tax=Limnospira platensis NIES-46 TaxID=1236695 RepID=A0A5M3TF39_LIMPL|nr:MULTISPECIES: hypothetical protein [Arthrospira]AMW30668.1 hypothetical protein AP285_24740 [Arthrospira platensis YZ]KDR55293.1 hypothetical protein APPUASWS_023250 [Arthrospira platensis str. Paraca]MBD2669991.1 hypothetical protein [Arthrospira platensis FACHB-439]MBD2710466.1 hypothetical protein [Arthrospira platensis FACHB-835]MDF2207341.1 hypothetical protein [Arthrospira platensis NCB002]MDT9310799.1 hypothetical protein [Limnospira sp. Paracas R14]QQW28605.1 hypothetical protein 